MQNTSFFKVNKIRKVPYIGKSARKIEFVKSVIHLIDDKWTVQFFALNGFYQPQLLNVI